MRGGTRHFISGIICAALSLGLSAACFGRVFWRRGAGTTSEVLALSRDWSRVLQSAVRINRGVGDLEIMGYDGDLRSAMRAVKRALSGAKRLLELEQGEGMARAIIESESGIMRIIAIEGMDSAATVVFMISQTPEEYAASLEPPIEHALIEAPPYPASVPKTFIGIEETLAQIEISHSPASPSAARDFFLKTMPSNGWTLIIPRSGFPADHSGAAVFQKGIDICCILVQRSDSLPESVITILHKKLKME